MTIYEKARRTNHGRDAIERAAGFVTPGDRGEPMLVRTAITALHAAIEARDWDIVAEAAVMLGEGVDFEPWKA